MKNSVKCTIAVRRIPLEQFRLEGDGRKWKKQARDRRSLLLELSTYANGDGTSGIFSPSIRTLIESGRSRATLYRHLNDLKELHHLNWTREKHYYRREYKISLPAEAEKQVSDSEENRSQIDENQVSDSLEQVSDSKKQVSQLVTPSVSYRPSLHTVKEREEQFALSKIEKHGPASQTAKAKSCSENGRGELAKEYFVWLFKNYVDLSLSVKERRIIQSFILSSNYDLETLKLATARIPKLQDAADSYAHAASNLTASLPDKCEAIRQELEQRRIDAENLERMKGQIRIEREAEQEAAEYNEETGNEVTMKEFGLEAPA